MCAMVYNNKINLTLDLNYLAILKNCGYNYMYF